VCPSAQRDGGVTDGADFSGAGSPGEGAGLRGAMMARTRPSDPGAVEPSTLYSVLRLSYVIRLPRSSSRCWSFSSRISCARLTSLMV
jgi:hypothetical protein